MTRNAALGTLLAAIVGVVALLSVRPFGGCAYSPDGALRWGAIQEWFAEPERCDVWAGIKPQKPIGTVQLYWRSDQNAPVLGRIAPDGSGFVAVLSPVIADADVLPQDGSFASIEQLAEAGTVFPIRSPDPAVYRAIIDQVAPVRDFQGQVSNILDTSNPAVRAAFGLDDPRTRAVHCGSGLSVAPEPLSWIDFGPPSGSGPVQTVLVDLRCAEAPYRGLLRREGRATALLVEAAGGAAEIDAAGRRSSPECKIDKMLCYGDVL